MTIENIINSAGVTLILLAFFLLTTGRLAATSRIYHILNLTGAGLACYGSYLIGAVPFVILEGTWAGVALYGLVKGQGRRALPKTIAGTRVIVYDEPFSILKGKAVKTEPFAVISEPQERTAIMRSSDVPSESVLAVESDFRLLTFDTVLPFNLTGFLAAVSTALAEAGIPLFAVSGYSTDHILVRSKHLDAAVRTLQSMGFTAASASYTTPAQQ